MKTLVILGAKTADQGTPYVTAQIDDYAWTEQEVRRDAERRGREVMVRDYGARPVRLVWIYQEVPAALTEGVLMALADGAQIPWDILEDRDLSDSGGSGQEPGTTEKVPPVRS